MLCCDYLLSHVRLFATQWTVGLQVPLSMGILQARMLKWVAIPSSRGSSQPKIQSRCPTLQANSLPAEIPGKPRYTYSLDKPYRIQYGEKIVVILSI